MVIKLVNSAIRNANTCNDDDDNLYFKIGSVCLCVPRFSASISPLYPATDCAAATDISGVSGRWQLSR